MVRTHVKLRDLNTNVPVLDDRSIEVLASGLPLHHGAQLAVDITPIRSDIIRGSLPQCFKSQRCHTGQGSTRQRTEIPRALGWRSMSFGRCGTGDRRQME